MRDARLVRWQVVAAKRDTDQMGSGDTQGVTHQRVALERLVAHPRNYRSHPEGQLARLEASLARFGQVRSIVVQEGADGRFLIVAGHGLVAAAQRSGAFSTLAADVIPPTWTPQQVEGYLVADNRLGELAEDDLVALAALLEEQQQAGFPLESLGTSNAELLTLYDDLAAAALAAGTRRSPDDPDGGGDAFDPETAVASDADARVLPGDLWALGAHRLLCGDATRAEDVARLMAGETADCVWTDPPYGVAYTGKTAEALTIQNDAMSIEALTSFLVDAFSALLGATTPGTPWYIAAPSGLQLLAFADALTQTRIWHQSLVWVKQSLVLSRFDYHYRHEHLFYGWTPGGAHRFYGDRKQDTVWEFDRPTAAREHPTMKPLPLILHALDLSTREGEIVLDGFGGSGSTLIACERAARRARLIELDPHYCAVILARYEQETGQSATLLARVVDIDITPDDAEAEVSA